MVDAARMRRRTVIPPEGIPLQLHVAQAGDRVGAFLFDGMIQVLLLMILILVALYSDLLRDDLGPSIIILSWFLIRTFYFTWFEVRWQGRTPGKKRAGIRVIDAQGGPLRTDAIVVRNLMREVEVWIPLVLLFGAEYYWPDAPGWARLLFCGWAFFLTGMPLFNRARMRAGDMVAGTLVVDVPKAVLLPDLGGQEVARRARTSSEYTFTDAQLDVYGIYELQVLEDLLRRGDANRREAMVAVMNKIAAKISWTGPRKHPERFLRAFYAALRARLEARMLLGKKKADKHN